MAADERQELKALLDRVEQAELQGDVGRMIFLAVENATDEREADEHELDEQESEAESHSMTAGLSELAERMKRLIAGPSCDRHGD